MSATGRRRKSGWAVVNILVIAYALFPVWWIIALSFKDPSTLTDGNFIPTEWTWENYQGIFKTSEFTRALINSIGIALISTVIAVVLGTMAAYAVARLRFPGKKLLIGMSLLIAMFPPISLVSPLFNIERVIGIFDTWVGLIIPYMTFSLPLAIYTLSAFFREIPWDLEKAAKVDGATCGAGVPAGDRSARGAGRVHHGDPGVHLLLERLPLRDLADLDLGGPYRRRRPSPSSRGAASSLSPPVRSPPPPW